jgi:hypothetical protein
MQLLPGTLTAPSIFRCGPFAFADDRMASAVDDQMDCLFRGNASELDIEMLAASREGDVAALD